jgi:hypothetical protein
MKEILINTHKNEVVGTSSIRCFGLNDAGVFVSRSPMDYDEAAAIRNQQEDAGDGRKLATHDGRSQMLGGDGVSAFDGWVLVEVPQEWWNERCGDELASTDRQAERVGGIVRKIRRQMREGRRLVDEMSGGAR